MNIILFGAPGAGKGTQSDKIIKDFGFFRIATGDLLREETNTNSKLGIEIKLIIDKGNLVPNKIINTLINNLIIKQNNEMNFLFDGYPRNLDQANDLDLLLKKKLKKIDLVFFLRVEDKILIKRIEGRVFCKKCKKTYNTFFNPPNCLCGKQYLEKRIDDNTSTVKKRLETYKKETFPVLEYYENKKILHKIDGSREITEIYSKIKDIIDAL